jgi:general secretion pathway protein K
MSTGSNRGGALLAVLWLSAALAAIGFSVANTVRGETERTGTAVDGTRAYYLATSGIERALFYIEIGPDHKKPDGTPRFYDPSAWRMHFEFPSGVADVRIQPEASKLSVNDSKPEDIFRLLLHLGVDPARAKEITAALVDWRSPVPGGISLFDQFYLASTPSFRAPHASLEEVEELLLVKGMTPELFYGSVVRDAQGRLQPQSGLRDCLSVYGSPAHVDVNGAPPPVLLALGVPPAVVAAIVQRRHAAPFRSIEEVAAFTRGAAGPAMARLFVGGGTIYTLHSTGRLRLPDGGFSDLSRTVSAVMKFHRTANNPPIETLRWYEN